MLLIGWVAVSFARDVVWLEPPSEGDTALLDRRPDVDGHRALVALRAALTAQSEADVKAWAGLDAALQEARRYETRLDGEALILQLLDGAMASVTLVPDEASRDRLFEVFAYQGFAANRLYGESLATDPAAEPWRVERAGQVLERPWADAWAVAPERPLTPYEVSEAPQRVAYGQRMGVFREALDGIVVLPERAAGDVVFVDGVPRDGAIAGQLTLPPGRHWIHVERDQQVIDRFVTEVASGGRTELRASLPPGALADFAGQLEEGATVPAAIRPLLDAMGSPWLARPRADDIVLFDVSSGTAARVVVDRSRPSGTEADPTWQISVGVLGGWLASDDFYLQDPTVDPTFGVVNALALGGYAQAGVEVVGPLWVGGGIDAIVPVGEGKVAQTGAQFVRPRFVPHVAVGLSWLQATAGVLFPYHVAVGGRVARPLGDRFEARLSGWFGAAPSRQRETDVWQGEPVFTVTGGVGVRLGR